MTDELRFTLLSDGSSDAVLMPILEWVLRQHSRLPTLGEWAELRHLAKPPRGLADRVNKSVELYPCNILFVHRDAENQDPQLRHQEILEATSHLDLPPVVCVVPVRMQEAWLLLDETAIRFAAGNPNGTMVLDMPRVRDVERIPDAKESLHQLLKTASGKKGRHLKRFNSRRAVVNLTQRTAGFAALRGLSAFHRFENDVRGMVKENGW